ncbi:DUF3567 family protein [Pseudazoarcus pumilus]|uniref:DUF3567 domain-containing protein n=1 Tax=Pseudazoarcus pumilus TaxID=2067960 RepID=A0A2I6S6R9_9RHOO|nr:DUF3567 family protein [Pseudazoarcus pumilus]AUN94954.1 hypothetical protein C0099_08410 [Pseudazoarcus pumilus]
MRVVCNSPELYVVDYPAIDAVEVIDKRIGRGGMMRDEAAQRFRAELELWAESADPDKVDEFIGHFGALMTQQAIYH